MVFNQDNQQPSLKAMKNIIYKITNLVNGKVYIGQTVKALCSRKAEHIHRCNFGERQHKLYKSMRKHGIENFKFEEIFHCLDKKHLDEMEKYFIGKHDSYEHGYNSTEGGDNISIETRQKISKALKGRKTPWLDKKAMDARRKNGFGQKPHWFKIRFPNGSVDLIQDLHKFCREMKLDVSNLHKTLRLNRPNCCKGYVLLERFNDYPEREYSQAAGNGAHP